MQKHIEFAKIEILGFFTQRNASAGCLLHWPSFHYQMTTLWSPKQQDAFPAALKELVESGFLEQNQKESIVLTKKGEDQIY